MTYALAVSIAKNEVTRRMAQEDRTVWNADDYRRLLEVLNKIRPLIDREAVYSPLEQEQAP